jgi:hypothetical protein
MALKDLVTDLSNFKWTDYEKAGTGKSPKLDGTTYYERPNPKSLEGMESKFGPIDTPPGSRGPYGLANNMDGTKQGRGFTEPGLQPRGFTKDVDRRTHKSELGPVGQYALTPLSHTIAEVDSALFYGKVGEKTINLEPQAEGAYGVTTLPISTYTSRLTTKPEFENYTTAGIGGYNTYYGNIDLLASRPSMFEDENGNYTTPKNPEFGDDQRTFLIPDAYPRNNLAFSINSQFGWSYQSKYLINHGTPWRGFKLRETFEDQMDAGGGGGRNITPEFYPPTPTPPQQTNHPRPQFYISSEPNYNAISYLAIQFMSDNLVTEGIWPYKVLDYEGTHPLIRKEIGTRVDTSNEITLKSHFAGEDFQRVEGWLETPTGQLWITKQNVLQQLNPREETREFSLAALKASVPPFIHATRHIGGGTYMNQADFGPLFDDTDDGGDGPTLGSIAGGFLAGKLNKSDFGKKVVGAFKSAQTVVGDVGEFLGDMDTKLNSLNSALGEIDFNAEGKGGRLRFLTNRMIAGDTTDDATQTISFKGNDLGSVNLTDLRNSSAPFGRTPKIPTNVTFSQRGAFGQGDAHVGMNGTAGSPVGRGRVGWISTRYSQLGHRYENRLTPMEIFNASWNYMDAEMTEQLALDSFDISIMEGSEDTLKQQGKYYKEYEDAGKETDKLQAVLKLTTVQHGMGGKLVGNTGHAGGYQSPVGIDEALGKIKGGDKDSTVGYLTTATDKINMVPYGLDNQDVPMPVDDFIKFKFKDLINDKFIVFRAILSGISDSVTPEWTGTRYIGRPDQVYVYTGTERKISFSFEIYPKTKQEFPVLLEKLNYLIGLCYPSYGENNRMVAPFINLTLGDMYDSPGFLDSLSMEVNDTSTWELDDGLQFPKHITCQCSFTYVGKYLPSMLGKHYELGWLTDNGYNEADGETPSTKGTFEGDNHHPTRTEKFNKIFSTLGADHTVEVEGIDTEAADMSTFG